MFSRQSPDRSKMSCRIHLFLTGARVRCPRTACSSPGQKETSPSQDKAGLSPNALQIRQYSRMPVSY